MRLYIKRKKGNIAAVAEYDFMAKRFVVLSGSKVSDEISYSEKFRGSKSIEKSRLGTVENSTVIEDVVFKSASTAANYVCGSSTNGLTAWKDEHGKTLKSLLEEMEGKNE